MHRSGRYASLRKGLVGAWCPSVSGSFGYSLPDLSGYGNHGALTNMDPASDWVTSSGNMALDFDGTNDYVKFSNTFYEMPFSVSMWALARNTTTAHTIFGIGNSTTIDPIFQVSFRGDQANDPIIAGMRGSDNTLNTFSAFNNYQAATWYHIAAVFYGASDRLVFVNGISGTRDTTTHTIEPLNQMSLGVLLRTSPVSYLNGQVDDVRQYNRALTPSEIQLLYTGGRGVGLISERRRWFYSAVAFTGTAAVTTGAATCSGSATHTTPTYTGTSTVTTGAATCSASGTFTKPVYSATSSVTIAAASCSATGTFIKPVYSGTSVLTVGHATASGAATFVAPVFTASASVAVGATVVNVAGSVVSPTFTGTAAVSVPAATVTATGTFSQFSQITASKPRRLNIVTHRASLNIATHAHVST